MIPKKRTPLAGQGKASKKEGRKKGRSLYGFKRRILRARRCSLCFAGEARFRGELLTGKERQARKRMKDITDDGKKAEEKRRRRTRESAAPSKKLQIVTV